MPRAFDVYLADGTLFICRRGDLWQRLPDEGEVSRWSYYGPVEEVSDTQLSPKYRAALGRLRQRWNETLTERRGSP